MAKLSGSNIFGRRSLTAWYISLTVSALKIHRIMTRNNNSAPHEKFFVGCLCQKSFSVLPFMHQISNPCSSFSDMVTPLGVAGERPFRVKVKSLAQPGLLLCSNGLKSTIYCFIPLKRALMPHTVYNKKMSCYNQKKFKSVN